MIRLHSELLVALLALDNEHDAARAHHFNAYYLAYVVLTGATSIRDARERDAHEFFDGCMVGFIIWINRQWAAFRVRNGFSAHESLNDAQRARFEDELAEQVADFSLGVVAAQAR